MGMAIIAGLSLIGAGTWLKAQQYEIESQEELVKQGMILAPTGGELINPVTAAALAGIGIGIVFLLRRQA